LPAANLGFFYFIFSDHYIQNCFFRPVAIETNFFQINQEFPKGQPHLFTFSIALLFYVVEAFLLYDQINTETYWSAIYLVNVISWNLSASMIARYSSLLFNLWRAC
jgi:hypothetical protein